MLSAMSTKPTLRIGTWNVWHALNPYGSPYGMRWLGPLLMPRLETRSDAKLRQIGQINALLGLRQSDFDVFCLQEINPIETRCDEVAQKLGMKPAWMRCNAGIKFGSFGLPLRLSDGLLTLTGRAFRRRKTVRIGLSGKSYEWQTPLGVPLFVQFEERRCAMMIESIVHGRKIAIVNLHLHSGPELQKRHRTRRKAELSRLARILARRASDADLLVVCGDFNCHANSKAMKPLLEIGLQDVASLAGSKQMITWDPEKNPLTQVSAQLALERFQECQGWEDKPHSFDRIYLRSQIPLKKVSVKRVFDEHPLSDHYGLMAEITF